MTKSDENRARRRLKKLGLRLEKTPSGHWLRREHGAGYMILQDNNVLLGVTHHQWDATLDEVFDFIDSASSKMNASNLLMVCSPS